ncbi:NAD(P)/FAD-dependent oxidoreductase [Alicycliphilus denitrificans]|uniref:FAD-dependent oxidoreductase n=1 Tax=Alicycliphilus denitrificans TaxID=179636 RepID=A0A420KC70_9BURK|nr:FAD-dependent oxidoreductase [Alicycliphilus denitrificans]RKJ96816.1 FAD-dependent oxidoreductase [Alicycliphilus denitrificans]
MIRLSEIKLPLAALPADAPDTHPDAALRAQAAAALGIAPAGLAALHVHKRSFDARKADLLAVYIVDVALADPAQESALLARHAADPHIQPTPDMAWRPVGHAPAAGMERPVVVGFGPCGIFAALVLAQMGLAPIVLERGKAVRERTRDTWGLWRRRELNPESNVQFGEGGAGTFSDGKLYSQIKDPRHLGRKVLQEFVAAGAPPEILYAAHPHIGTFRLVKMVQALRAQIIALGGEVRFEQRVTDVLLEDRRLSALRVLDLRTGQESELATSHAVLALGHSARDSFAMLHARGVAMQAKPFSVGVRIEHPQGVIDRARWGRHAGHPLLGAADYKLVHHASGGRTVYSFCMCPGGTVVAATSEPGRVVTNGMSQYSRAERNANAGMVVGVDPRDYPRDPAAFEALLGATHGVEALPPGQAHPLAGVVLQRQLESRAFALGGGDYNAPAQRVGDFLARRASTALGEVEPSYKPGVTLASMDDALPAYATEAMREALPAFARKIRGYDMADAVLTGVETRTSAPLRIDRGENFQSLNTPGLYPAGEGAGYAGGILSAGVDGIKVGEAVACAMLGLPLPSSGMRGSGGAA